MLPVVKHFPGHGSLGPTATPGCRCSRRSLARLRAPRPGAVRRAPSPHGAPAVLTGHIAVKAVDRGVPASISRKVTTGLLRRDLGFVGSS